MNNALDLMDELMRCAERELAMARELHAKVTTASDPAEHLRLSRAFIRHASAARRALKQRHQIRLQHLREARSRAASEWPNGRAGGLH